MKKCAKIQNSRNTHNDGSGLLPAGNTVRGFMLRLRLGAGLSQLQLGAALGLSRGCITSRELGRSPWRTSEVAAAPILVGKWLTKFRRDQDIALLRDYGIKVVRDESFYVEPKREVAG